MCELFTRILLARIIYLQRLKSLQRQEGSYQSEDLTGLQFFTRLWSPKFVIFDILFWFSKKFFLIFWIFSSKICKKSLCCIKLRLLNTCAKGLLHKHPYLKVPDFPILPPKSQFFVGFFLLLHPNSSIPQFYPQTPSIPKLPSFKKFNKPWAVFFSNGKKLHERKLWKLS